MQPRTGLLALAVLLLVAAAPTQKQIDAEKDKLIGTYELLGMEINGQSIDVPEVVKDRHKFAVVTRKTITFKANARERENTYRIDPTKDPKTIDLMWRGKDGKEHVTLGIYFIREDKLKLCLAVEDGRKRPTGDLSDPFFETKRGTNWKYLNLHREKR
jgi:uncharacterized protein (TIGR03067 family)